MITKKRELQIRKLEEELNCGQGIHEGRNKFFRRSRFVSRQTSHHKPSNTMHLPRHSFNESSKDHEPRTPRPAEQQRLQHKSLYDRPFHLLRQYLTRKQKHTFMPLFDTNPERTDDITKAYTTLNEFRIKKSKKTIAINPNVLVKMPQNPPSNKISKIDEDFISFNTSKNLYQMTHQQLQESIKWKKQFLNMLNEKIKVSKAASK